MIRRKGKKNNKTTTTTTTTGSEAARKVPFPIPCRARGAIFPCPLPLPSANLTSPGGGGTGSVGPIAVRLGAVQSHPHAQLAAWLWLGYIPARHERGEVFGMGSVRPSVRPSRLTGDTYVGERRGRRPPSHARTHGQRAAHQHSQEGHTGHTHTARGAAPGSLASPRPRRRGRAAMCMRSGV